MEKNTVNLEKLKERWPSAWVARKQVGEFTGGLVAVGSMRNHDCYGTGPRRFLLKGRVGYQVDDLIEWLSHHIKAV